MLRAKIDRSHFELNVIFEVPLETNSEEQMVSIHGCNTANPLTLSRDLPWPINRWLAYLQSSVRLQL